MCDKKVEVKTTEVNLTEEEFQKYFGDCPESDGDDIDDADVEEITIYNVVD